MKENLKMFGKALLIAAIFWLVVILPLIYYDHRKMQTITNKKQKFLNSICIEIPQEILPQLKWGDIIFLNDRCNK